MNILNFIFPKKCAVCGEFTGKELFCEVCAAKYEQLKRVPCKYCGLAHSLCRCRAEKLRGEKRVTARHLFAYEGETAKSLIYKLKRKNLCSLQKLLALELARLIKEELRTGEECMVTFAPRAKKSILEYGFDQAEILAREAAKILSLPMEAIFERERNANTQQKMLGAKEREQNAQSAFFVNEGAELCGKTLVIIDDVTTTGSTAGRLCSLALEEGAKRIIFVSVAKT
jgi:ComF family protein